MKIGISYLSVQDKLEDKIKEIDESSSDYIHVDVMDGEFVENITRPFEDIYEILKDTKHPKDIHLMVSNRNLKEYIDNYARLNPEYITFHLEETLDDYQEYIDYIHSLGIKVGLAINPDMPLNFRFEHSLKNIDLLLIMSVFPGKGGQSFIPETEERVETMYYYRKDTGYKYIIEVDGGITNETINNVENANLSVVGSYITNSNNYQEKIDILKEQS